MFLIFQGARGAVGSQGNQGPVVSWAFIRSIMKDFHNQCPVEIKYLDAQCALVEFHKIELNSDTVFVIE